jgi:hypothetical protein
MASKAMIEWVQKYYKAEIRKVFDEIKKENVPKTFLVCQVEKPNKEKCGHTYVHVPKNGTGNYSHIFVMSISLNHFLAKR